MVFNHRLERVEKEVLLGDAKKTFDD